MTTNLYYMNCSLPDEPDGLQQPVPLRSCQHARNDVVRRALVRRTCSSGCGSLSPCGEEAVERVHRHLAEPFHSHRTVEIDFQLDHHRLGQLRRVGRPACRAYRNRDDEHHEENEQDVDQRRHVHFHHRLVFAAATNSCSSFRNSAATQRARPRSGLVMNLTFRIRLAGAPSPRRHARTPWHGRRGDPCPRRPCHGVRACRPGDGAVPASRYPESRVHHRT